MEMTATLKVRPESADDSKPSRSRVEEAAEQLRAQGFEVLHVGRFGVSVRAARPIYKSILGVQLDTGKPLVSQVKASEPKLATLVESIEYAPAADLYTRVAR